MQPETKYARSGDVNIAYQVVGEGPLDLVLVPRAVSHLEWYWEEPSLARFLHRLASFTRLIRFDKRGTGLSDRVSLNELPTLEQRMDDVRAVMDAVGSERAALLGVSEGGPMSVLFAATYPERTTALVLYGAIGMSASDPQLRPSSEQFRPFFDAMEQSWGRGLEIARFAPSRADDDHFKQWFARLERLGASPGAFVALVRMNMEMDIRQVLPAVRVPTLVLHRTGDLAVPVEEGRYLAQHIPGAKYVELPGTDHFSFVGDQEAILQEVEEFLTGVRHVPDLDRVLATVLFTDIVRSTERAAEMGDGRWRDLLKNHNEIAQREITRFRGREIKGTGDGVLATFDGPSRGVRCARAICDSVRPLGIELRAGLHTGECELLGDDVGGIAVHIAARVAAQADPSEVLVSSTVKDLVAGSGIEFEDRGTPPLKGVPGEWRLFLARA